MTTIGRRARAGVFLRSFLIQGSWNYRTLIGGGFAFALLPVLRQAYADDPAGLKLALQRHVRLFNSHPYLAPIALGAVSAAEMSHQDPQLIERFKAAVRGSLGTLGDRLVWAGWRPVNLLFTLALLFLGVPWWVAVTGFLLLYNAGQLLLRGWGFSLGLHEMTRVGERLRRSPIGRIQHMLTVTGSFLAGLLLPLAVAGLHLPETGRRHVWQHAWFGAAMIVVILAIRYGPRVRQTIVLSLAGFTLLGLLMRMLP